MKRLSYQTLADIGSTDWVLKSAPERVLQFGEGNFLRAFVEHFIDEMNEKAGFDAKVVLVQPIAPGLADMINEQEGLYTLYLRGMENGQETTRRRLISCVSRCINPYEDYRALLDCAKNPDLRFLVSNTTEAGIAFDPASAFDETPPGSFPAKLTRFLYERFVLGLPGFVILSCELIDNNGKELQRCVEQYIDLWDLPEPFRNWVRTENIFCSTLVDRIVTGYPRAEADALCAENGYIDTLLDTGELFGFWVIEGPDWIKEEFPVEAAGLPILITADHSPYKQRKVRILNGAHTALVPVALLEGKTTVRECMEDAALRAFLTETMENEIIPTLTLPRSEIDTFAAAVIDRFQNPYINHALLSIALNTTAKWRARLMPSLLAYYEKFQALPPNIVRAFAAYIKLYQTNPPQDDGWVLDFFAAHKNDPPRALAEAVIRNERMWGGALETLPGFIEAVAELLGG